MINLEYNKVFSLKNINSVANKKVIAKLIYLNSKSEKANSMRITIINRGAFQFPYTLTLKRKIINEERELIEIVIRVEMMKLFLISLISSTLLFTFLFFVFDARWLSFIALFYAVIIYQIGRKKILNYTDQMVSGWLESV